jgi:Kae1-associated kinase Bud32
VELIKKGAEAELYAIMYNGRPAVLKRRIPKRYRVPELDQHIRKTRTRREARLLERARRAGVHTPEVLHVDDKNMEIIMGRVEGTRLKEFLLSGGDYHIMRDVGHLVATLHCAGIIHGDLTTSNIILSNGEIYFIDFGLGAFSKSVEDRAVDLVCFEKSFLATHSDIFDAAWHEFLRGYEDSCPDAPSVFRRVETVKRRARYL